MTEGPDPPEPQPVEILSEPAQMAGTYANLVRITFTDHEFTLDFIRVDHSTRPLRGIVVARVAMAATVAAQTTDLLGRQLQEYAQKVIGRETDKNAGDEPGQGGELKRETVTVRPDEARSDAVSISGRIRLAERLKIERLMRHWKPPSIPEIPPRR